MKEHEWHADRAELEEMLQQARRAFGDAEEDHDGTIEDMHKKVLALEEEKHGLSSVIEDLRKELATTHADHQAELNAKLLVEREKGQQVERKVRLRRI